MRRLLFLAGLICAAHPTAAQHDVLLPDASAVFGGNVYMAVVGEVLSRDLAACRGGIQMVTLPSFSTERSAGICQTQGGFVAYSAIPQQSVWYAGQDTTGTEPWCPERARTVGIDRAEAGIDPALAVRVATVWARALRTTRLPADPDPAMLTIRGDGETVHFASFAPVMLTAHAWSPSPESVPGAMIALGTAIEAVARRRSPAGTLETACARLETMLPVGTNP